MKPCMPCALEEAAPAAIVYRNDSWSCEMVDGYDVPGWFVLRLRRHAEGWESLTPEELAEFGGIAQLISSALVTGVDAAGAYFMSFGENYKHFHFLVIARPHDLSPELRGASILQQVASDRDREAALVAAGQVREALRAGR